MVISPKTCFIVSLHGDLSWNMFYCITPWWSLSRHVLLYHHMVISQETCLLYHHMVISKAIFYCITIWWSLKPNFTVSPYGDLSSHIWLYHHMVISNAIFHCITIWWSLKPYFTVSPYGDLSSHILLYHPMTILQYMLTLSQHETFDLHISWSYHQKSQLIAAQLYLHCNHNWFLYICSSLAHHIHHKGQYYWNQYNPKINKFLFNNNSNQCLLGSNQCLIQTLAYLQE